ncbi:MAG: TonB-dependent receptor plug domain-containing protein, partial [Alphaproteobacteria bacterium]|nr:TonB-dependent receptor plug domain-containing protein [Alphaproteobacteria bacterium]
MKYTDVLSGAIETFQAGRARHPTLLVVSSLFALTTALGCAGGASAADSREAVAATGTAGSASTVEEVIVTARQRRHVEQFVSDQTIKVLDQDQIKAASAVGGAAKALALIPGVSAASYGATGSQKTTLSIDGIKLGWAGFSGGNPDNGSIGVSFDGAPMSDPGNGLWQTTLVPQASLLQTISVTYGPGNPSDRWYTNIGGGLNFTPVQPSATAGGSIEATYGSFNTRNIDFTLQT